MKKKDILKLKMLIVKRLHSRRTKDIAIVLTIIISCIITIHGLTMALSDKIENDNRKYNCAEISLYMNKDNALDCRVDNLCIDTKYNGKKLNMNSFEWFEQDGLELNAFKMNSDMCYIQYSNENETYNRELALSKTSYNWIDTSELTSTGGRIMYVDKVNSNKVAASTFLETCIIMSESSTDRKLGENNYYKMLSNIEDKLYVSDNNNYDVNINLNNIGTISINDMSNTCDSIKNVEITFLKSDEMIKIASNKTKDDYFYISCINNNVVEYLASEFEASDIKGVYTSLRDTKSNDTEYETIAILGKTELFIFRINEKYKDSIVENIVTQLNLI